MGHGLAKTGQVLFDNRSLHRFSHQFEPLSIHNSKHPRHFYAIRSWQVCKLSLRDQMRSDEIRLFGLSFLWQRGRNVSRHVGVRQTDARGPGKDVSLGSHTAWSGAGARVVEKMAFRSRCIFGYIMVLSGFISIIHRVHPCNWCTLLQGGTKIPEFPSVIIWMLFLPDFCTNAFDQGLKQFQLAYISVLSSHIFPVVCQAYLDLNC